jgi:hypothetical protein
MHWPEKSWLLCTEHLICRTRSISPARYALRRAADELAGKYPAADLLGIYLGAL